jgi:porphobilinogen synthase
MDDLSHRPRRLRRTPAIRRLVAETSVTTADLVAPLFVAEALAAPKVIDSLPGHFQHTLDSLVAEAERLLSVGITSVVLFGIPATKDAAGSGASDEGGIIQVALRRLAAEFGDALVLIPDLCLDEYTDHGHCGLLAGDGSVDNDATLVRYQAAFPREHADWVKRHPG